MVEEVKDDRGAVSIGSEHVVHGYVDAQVVPPIESDVQAPQSLADDHHLQGVLADGGIKDGAKDAQGDAARESAKKVGFLCGVPCRVHKTRNRSAFTRILNHYHSTLLVSVWQAKLDKQVAMGSPMLPGDGRVLPKHCRSAVESALQCRHGKLPAQCHECARCPHGKQRQECRECNSASRRWCPHNKRKHDCKDCSGCPHNKVKRCCKACNGSAVCPHGRLRKNCRECIRASAHDKCIHGRARARCSECRPTAASAGSAVQSEHVIVMSVSLAADSRQTLPQQPPPPSLDGSEGGGAGLGHEALAALEDQHKQMTADDASGLQDSGQVGLQVLGVDMGASGLPSHVPLQPSAALGGGRAHPPASSVSPKVSRPMAPDLGIGGGVVEHGVTGVDDVTSSLPPLRLCPHEKPKGECGDCAVKALMPSSPVQGALGQEMGKKRLDDFETGGGGGKIDGTDVIKTLVVTGHAPTSDLLVAHMASAPDGGLCEHNRARNQCDSCSMCRHSKMKSKCKECALCETHGRLRHDCRECNAGSRRWCPHNKRKHDCKDCSGCPHNRVKRCCKDCNGSAVCPHARLRKNCRECKIRSAAAGVVS
jgi:hypothetical protein